MDYPHVQPASTVIITSVTTKWPNKILLLKRSTSSTFLPGAYVFPGGRVEPADKILAKFLARDSDNFSRFADYLPNFNTQTILYYLAAMIREAYEESNIGLVKLKNSAYLAPTKITNFADNQDYLKPNLNSIWPLSRWITPLGEPRRYDTVFFLALVPDNIINKPTFDTDGETLLGRWIYPDQALESYEKNEIFLAPPTRAMLERISISNSLEDFLHSRDKPIRAIRPYFINSNLAKKILVLPGDKLHNEPNKSEFILHTRYEF